MKESKIQTQIIKYFQLKGFIVIVHVGKIGFPDLLILEGQGMHFWVEVKTETGVLSEVQKKTIDKLRATGDRVYVCRSEHDARKII